MDKLSFQNPLFATYVIAATLMILKAAGMSWLTVARMIKVNGGFRSPEDLQKTPFNPHPDPIQLERNEYVERVRRIHQNDIKTTSGSRVLLFGYVALRLLHSAAYLSAQTHDMRAIIFTPASLILIYITCRSLLAAFGV